MILSKDDIEEIATSVIADFREMMKIDEVLTPIDRLAEEYLGLDVIYEKLSNDSSFCGVTAYADTQFMVNVNGITKLIYIKKNQIILDSDFIDPFKIHMLYGKRRFTLAHEVAHQILFSLKDEEKKATMQQMYSARKVHTVRKLKTAEDWNEWQANALGAALLMPRESVNYFMMGFESRMRELGVKMISEKSLYVEQLLKKMCFVFGVSKIAATIRLKELGYQLIDDYTMKEVQYG